MSSHKLPAEQVVALYNNTETKDDMFYETLRNLSETVIEYRKKNGLTNRQLATMSGITTSVMARVESGYQNISLSTICKVLSVINKDIKFVDKG